MYIYTSKLLLRNELKKSRNEQKSISNVLEFYSE